ncbi:MAG: class I tRNA ligase family protein, partial [Candidatus Bathyarchaeia archaeon]
DWVNSIDIDWVISRRRYYGTEIPLWYCKQCGYIYVPKPGRYYQPWREKAPIDKCPKCSSTEFRGEERTFDTWFDSATSEVYVLGYLWNKDFFEKNFPCTLRPQGKEIVRNWLYFTILKSLLLFGKAPFKNVWIHMHVVDEEGKKMSKSAGNVVDPQEVIKRFGSEAFRIWSALEGNITKGDIRCSFERIKGTSKFLTKLWNIARFLSSFPQVSEGYELTPLDKMILAKLNELIKECRTGYEKMNAFQAATAIRTFTWNIFADHYLEAAKSRAYNRGGIFNSQLQRGAWFTLHKCLETILKLLAPLCPFITEAIWVELYSKESIHIQRFPEENSQWKSDLVQLLPKFIEFNNAIWQHKKNEGLALSQELPPYTSIIAPIEYKPLKQDLEAMHKINLRFEKPESGEKIQKISENIFIAQEVSL